MKTFYLAVFLVLTLTNNLSIVAQNRLSANLTFGQKLSNAALSIIDPTIVYNPKYVSIKYPNVANFINRMEIPPAAAVDSIVRFLKKNGHNSTPKFFYTKAKSIEKENTWYPKDKDALNLYLSMNGYSLKLFNDSLKIDPKGTKADYEEFIKEVS